VTRILTSERIAQSPSWRAQTTLVALSEEVQGSRWRALRALKNALKLVATATSKDIVILTDVHGLSGNLFCLLRQLGPRRPTIIRADALFTLPQPGLVRTLKRSYIRSTMAGVDLMIVWSPSTIERYCATLGLQRQKFAAVKFHHTLAGFDITGVKQGNYIFSGGDSSRDYQTLLQAVAGLDIEVFIATRLALPKSLDVPANVTMRATTPREFRELMAGASLVVFPLKMDALRTSGQQSYLNAMALGKAVIVTDTFDAPFYIEDGQTGRLTPSGDAGALRQAITGLLASPEKIAALGEAGRQSAVPLDQEYTWSRVLALARAAHQARTHPIRQ
jgi:glycosyltransferase involved in cell wall biosynthesis